MTVEINGIGRFLPAILKREMRALHQGTAVIDHNARIPKAQRILEGFDAVLAARNLSVHDSVRATPFLNEMREWRPSTTRSRDGGSIFGRHDERERIRVRRIARRHRHRWRVRIRRCCCMWAICSAACGQVWQ